MKQSNQIIETISKKIHYKRNDNIINHLKTYFQLDPINYSGSFTDTRFSLWRYSAWSGMFYVVIQGRITTDKNRLQVLLTTKINSAGQLFMSLIFLCFLIDFDNFSFSFFTFDDFVPRFICVILICLAMGLAYFHERKKSLFEIQEILKNVC